MTVEEINVLVIDDVNSIRVQVKELLRIFGFRKIKAASGAAEAFRMMEQERFELILCDWHMAPMDGLELLKQARSLPMNAGSAFIMVTAEATREKVIEAIKSGVDDYLIKPLTAQQIKTKVFNALVKNKVLA